MPTKNDDLWRTEASGTSDWSQFFRNSGKREVLEETPPSSRVSSTVADHRPILNLLFMIDVSGSMRGQRIGMVNYALENIFKELRRRDDIHSAIKVGVMEFSEDASWVTPRPVLLDDYVFTKIEAQPWLTNYAPAFDLLGQKLSRSAFMDPALGEYFEPVILFITDGEPTDTEEYPAALERLGKNGWFKHSARYAIAVGEEARSQHVAELLSRFTGDAVNVRYADEGEALCSLIQYVAIRASEVQTSMLSVGGGSGGKKQEDSIFDGLDDSLFSSLLRQK